MPIQAVNNFVFIIRDESEKESGGLVYPGQGLEKPNSGTIVSIGDLVEDKNIKKAKGKSCLFNKNNGFELEFEGQTYVVLEGTRIIAIV